MALTVKMKQVQPYGWNKIEAAMDVLMVVAVLTSFTELKWANNKKIVLSNTHSKEETLEPPKQSGPKFFILKTYLEKFPHIF